MDAATKVALTKFKAGDARNKLQPGEYEVDQVVRVKGTIKVGEDYTQHIVAKAEPWRLFAIALSKLNGVTVASIVKEAENIDSDALADVKKTADKAIQSIKNMTNSSCKGKVTSKLEFVEVVQAVLVNQAA